MSKTNIAIVIYLVGLALGAIFLDIWSAETSPKALLGIGWTTLFAIALFFAEKEKEENKDYFFFINSLIKSSPSPSSTAFL